MDDMVDVYGFLMILHTVSMASMFFLLVFHSSGVDVFSDVLPRFSLR